MTAPTLCHQCHARTPDGVLVCRTCKTTTRQKLALIPRHIADTQAVYLLQIRRTAGEAVTTSPTGSDRFPYDERAAQALRLVEDVLSSWGITPDRGILVHQVVRWRMERWETPETDWPRLADDAHRITAACTRACTPQATSTPIGPCTRITDIGPCSGTVHQWRQEDQTVWRCDTCDHITERDQLATTMAAIHARQESLAAQAVLANQYRKGHTS